VVAGEGHFKQYLCVVIHDDSQVTLSRCDIPAPSAMNSDLSTEVFPLSGRKPLPTNLIPLPSILHLVCP